MHLVPVTVKDAESFVQEWHRHSPPIRNVKFCVGVANDGILVGVAMAGHPVARHYCDGRTLEVRRVATDGHPNACSMLYGACVRAGYALGYTRLITYTLESEAGSSLRAAGWRVIAERPARKGWDTPSRPRPTANYKPSPRLLWEAPNNARS